MIESNVKKDLEYKIDLYVNGKLSQEEVDELWAELIQDGYYLDYAKSVANLKAVIESNRQRKQVAPVYTLRKVINYGAAAAIAIIIGVISVVNYSSTNTQLNISALEQLDLGTIRGSESNPAFTASEVIKEAIEMVNNGNVAEAIDLLESKLTETTASESVAEISLALGSIHYNYGEYESAVSSFENVTSQSSIEIDVLEKGYWYLGNTYLQLDRLAEAESAFQKVVDMGSQFSRIAKTNLDALQQSR